MALTLKQEQVASELKKMLATHFKDSRGMLLAVVTSHDGQGERGIEMVTNIKDPALLAAVCSRIAEHVKLHGKRTAS